ncbi:MAG: DUF4194 domain-containing protein [Nitrospirae bacterium]|nr:DUF4194 domain-containing protein [Nitrospirota bacterium]
MWSDTEANPGTLPSEFSRVAITLMKGVLYRDASPLLWQSLLRHQPGIRDYVAVLGLELLVDEGEGYAFLRQAEPPEGTAPSQELPRLVPQRPLGYLVSLLLVLLRKKIAESEARSGEARLILTADDMVEMVRLFLPDTANEVRQQDRIRAQIGRIAEMGFLRKLPGAGDRYEVGRILKAFINAQWIADFDRELSAYAREEETPPEPDDDREESA